MTTTIEESRAAIRAALLAIECALDVATRANDQDEVRARLRLVRTTLTKAIDAPRSDAVLVPDTDAEPDAPEPQPDAEPPAFGRLLQGYKLPQAQPSVADVALAAAPGMASAQPFGTMLPPAQVQGTFGNKAPIRHDSGRNVYGESFDPEMLSRAERDRINPADLRRAILAVRHYAVRGYIAPMPTTAGKFFAYSKRRDGKVQMGIVDAGAVLQSEPF